MRTWSSRSTSVTIVAPLVTRPILNPLRHAITSERAA
jgi:hypothetical protein